MAYDDDDDLFEEEFDFVDEDDAEDSGVKEPAPPPKKRPASRDQDKGEKPPARGPKRKPATSRREPRRDAGEAKPSGPPAPGLEPAPVGYLMGDDALEQEPPEIEAEAAPPARTGPPADHVVHIYQYGKFKRTIARKFTDEEAVSFAEEYTRTGKAYGRYAVATPEDEEPAPTFAGAAKG